MYESKLAVALKSAGKVLREFKDTVYVPFGSEYSIFIKNMNTVRALVTVTVDGQDIGDGTKFVVNANDSIEIERFVKNGNLNAGNRLKFIERTGAVENHRGIGIEDGLVRVEFQFEKKIPAFTPTYPPYISPTIGSPWKTSGYNPDVWYGTTTCSDDGIVGQQTFTASASSTPVLRNASNVTLDSMVVNHVDVENDAGVTVEGSVSEQKFQTVSTFLTEAETHAMVLKILGETESNKVKKAITVKTKQKCTTCGHLNKATAKFCVECGTSLQIV